MNNSLLDNKYEKLEPIGVGGSGTVWKARNVVDDYYCAIKILGEPVRDAGDKAYQALAREFQLMRRAGSFGHPGIPQLYNIGICNREAYIEMSYYKGDSIYDILAAEKILPFSEIVSMFKDILGTMAYLHVDIYEDLMNAEDDNLQTDLKHGGKIILRKEDTARLISKYGIVHNDIHSKQFIRNHYNGKYVLLDFGLAIQGKNAVRRTHLNAGTPGYSAPEKIRGNAAPDARTDVFALGALMFECLTGDVPFPDDNFNEKIASIDEKRSAAFTAKYPGKALTPDYLCPKWLSDIILKCLSFEPGKRYPNAKALLADFDTKLNEYISKKADGLSGLDNDIIGRQKQLLEAKDRRIASQQELISDNEQQIAKLDEVIKKTKSDLQASIKKVETLGKKQNTMRRARNIGWAVAIILSCIIAISHISRGRSSLDDPETIGQLNKRVTILSDSLTIIRSEDKMKATIINESKRRQASLEKTVSELNEKLAALKAEYSAEMGQLRDSLSIVRRSYASASRRVVELEGQANATARSSSASATSTVVIGGSNNGSVNINNGNIRNENMALKRELASCRVIIDSLTATVGRYRAELANAAKNL